MGIVRLVALRFCRSGGKECNGHSCGGQCSGTSAACSYPTSACGTASCNGSSYQAAGTCSAGGCNLPAAKTCQYGCSVASGGCTCAPGLTGPHCDLSRFVVLTPSTVAADSYATGTNADGTVVTGCQAGAAFAWTQTTGSLPLVLSPSISSSVGNGINADGTVIVGQFVSSIGGSPQQAFRWTKATGMVPLVPSGTTKESAQSVTADGSTIVGYTDRFVSGSGPFRWTSATGMAPMAAVTGATASEADHISGDGSVAIGFGTDSTGYVGIRWSGSAEGQVLSFPAGFSSTNPIAVTSDGSAIFGMFGAFAGPGTPFKWTSSAGAVVLSQSVLGVWGLAGVQ